MKPARDEPVTEEALFFSALSLPPEQRDHLLAQVTGRDPALAQRVAGLLRAHQSAALTAPAVVAADSEARPGGRIDRFIVLQRIGEGGVGEVYLAEQMQPFRRLVALKLLKPGMDTREIVARFETERQALALMDHPNIARVFDAGETAGGRPYFAMELVLGRPIVRYCAEQRLSFPDRLTLFTKVCHAIGHAHAKGVIHRDIKSSNVLVTTYDGEAVPKVIDFGVAKALAPRLTDNATLTSVAQVIGTPAYMSPEQVAGDPVDARTDVYSLGVLLYELIAGTRPFSANGMGGPALEALRRQIRDEPAPAPAQRLREYEPAVLAALADERRMSRDALVAAVRTELQWIVLCALEKDRDARYATAGALAADVERYLRNQKVMARPQGRFAAWRRRLRSPRRPAADPGRTGGSAAEGRTPSSGAGALLSPGAQGWSRSGEDTTGRGQCTLDDTGPADPGWPQAQGGIASGWIRRAIVAGVATPHIAAMLEHAERHARLALAADPHTAEAHAALGMAALLRGQLRPARESLDRALALNPQSNGAWLFHAKLLQREGRPDLALADLDRARSLSAPAGQFTIEQAFALIESGHYAAALAALDVDPALEDALSQAHAVAALALAKLGRGAAAAARAQAALDSAPQLEATEAANHWVQGLAALAFALADVPHEADRVASKLLEAPVEHRYCAGCALAALGNRGAAFSVLADTPQFVVDVLLWFASEDGPTRSDPRLPPLLRRLEATDAFETVQLMRRDAAAGKPAG